MTHRAVFCSLAINNSFLIKLFLFIHIFNSQFVKKGVPIIRFMREIRKYLIDSFDIRELFQTVYSPYIKRLLEHNKIITQKLTKTLHLHKNLEKI